MIYLGENDICTAATVDELLDAIEASMLLYETGDFLMPQRMYIDHGQDTLLLMPCFTKDYFGTKLVSLFADNPQRGLPVLNGLVVLNDGETGVPVALLDGPALTALRTAAVGSVSIRHLAQRDVGSIGVVGAGVQGYYQAWIACASQQAEDLFVFDIQRKQASVLKDRLSGRLERTRIHCATSVEELLEASEVVITATTSAEPVLPEVRQLLEGKHIVAIGTYKPDARELPHVLFDLVENVFVDTDHALDESGDLVTPLQEGWIDRRQVTTLGRFLRDGAPIEGVRSRTTLFKSVGMALFDVCASRLIYEKAVQKGFGQTIGS